jgi:hypothetical protein
MGTHVSEEGRVYCALQARYFKVTERGQGVLAQNPPPINGTLLKQYPEFIEFSTVTRTSSRRAHWAFQPPKNAAKNPAPRLSSLGALRIISGYCGRHLVVIIK